MHDEQAGSNASGKQRTLQSRKVIRDAKYALRRWIGHRQGSAIRLDRVRCEAKESAVIVESKKPRRHERVR